MVEGADSGVEIWVLHGDEKRGLVYQAPFFIRKKLPGAGSVGIKMIIYTAEYPPYMPGEFLRHSMPGHSSRGRCAVHYHQKFLQ